MSVARRTYDFSNLRTLVVDDSLMMRRLVHQLLLGFGVGTVVRAESGVEGIQQLEAGHFDMVITDLMMEPIDGFEFTRLVRTSEVSPNRTVPILMMTAHSEMWRVAAARDAGVNEFIVKPITGELLLSRMIYMIESPRDFVRTSTYFGPDRRRKAEFPYFGPERRSDDRPEDVPKEADAPAESMAATSPEEAAPEQTDQSRTMRCGSIGTSNVIDLVVRDEKGRAADGT